MTELTDWERTFMELRAMDYHGPECEHPDTAFRWKLNSLGHRFYVRQCVLCGRSIGGAVAFATVRTETGGREPPPFDNRLHDEQLRLRVQASSDAAALSHRDWWERYELYLQSDAWREKRRLVFERANFLCEGCRQRPAVEVHHLTYAHVGNELLFELVAVCQPCHDQLHDDEL